MTKIVNRLKAPPKKCVSSGKRRGEMIDTEVSIRNYGRVYLALSEVIPLMRSRGWKSPDDLAEQQELISEQQRELESLRSKAVAYDDILSRLSDHLPQPKERTRTEYVTKKRPPTEEEMEQYLTDNPGSARRIAQEVVNREWHNLYADIQRNKESRANDKRHQKNMRLRQRYGSTAGDPEPEEVSEPVADGDEDRFFDLHGTTVDLDEILEMSHSKVVEYATGHGPHLPEQLAVREEVRGQGSNKKVRRKLVTELLDLAESEGEAADDDEDGEDGETADDEEQIEEAR